MLPACEPVHVANGFSLATYELRLNGKLPALDVCQEVTDQF